MDRWAKQKISKETQTLNDTVNQLDVIDIYRAFHPKTMNFTFFSSEHGNFSRTEHILDHKAGSESISLNRLAGFFHKPVYLLIFS